MAPTNLTSISAWSFLRCSEGLYFRAFLEAKRSPSSFFTRIFLARLKYLSLRCAGTSTSLMSNLVEVAMRYLWLTLLRGQPLTLKGPVTRERRSLALGLSPTLPVPGAALTRGVLLALCW